MAQIGVVWQLSRSGVSKGRSLRLCAFAREKSFRAKLSRCDLTYKDLLWKTNHPPTCTIGRRSESLSAWRKTSCVTGAVSPSPNAMYFNKYEIGFPSLQPK